MMPHSEVDEALFRLGSVEPPAGLQRRINLRLQAQPSRAPIRMVQALAAFALAASAAFTVILLNPALRNLLWHSHAGYPGGLTTVAPHGAAPVTTRGFGAAAAVHVPAGPVAVPPTPVNQGRGHSRSGSPVRPNAALPPPSHRVTPTAPGSAQLPEESPPR